MLKICYEYKSKLGTPTIVFLHGWGMSGSSFDGIINRIVGECSVLKIDLYGFGQSQEPLDYFDTHEYAYQIFLLLKYLKIDNVILVGHSFGGRLGILLSSMYDINISGLILTSSAGLNRFSLKKYLKVKRYKFVKYLVAKKLINVKYLNGFGSTDYMNARGNLRDVFTRVVNQDLRKFVSKIKVKNVMLVWDKKDKETPYWICKKLHRKIQNSKVVLYRMGGHFVAFKNQNKFASVINDLINEISDV